MAEKRDAELYCLRQKALSNAIANYFNSAIKDGDIVGAGVSIVSGDSVIFSEGFGKRSSNGDKKVDDETVFRLGSISKGFTGVLAAKLQSEKKFDFDDQVVKYIPEFHFGDDKNTEAIKISNILSHTSGTPYHSFTNLVEAGIPMSNIVKQFDKVQPVARPGEQYSYQNAMFALSQEVMLKATGKDIQHLLVDRFFEPLGMSTASTDYKSLSANKNVALPHGKHNKGWRKLSLNDHYDNAVAAGGINASSKDMAKWMRFLLGHNPEVMSSEVINEVFRPVITYKNKYKYYQRWPGHVSSSYGFGWRIHTFQNGKSGEIETMWHHGGSVNNFRNEIALFPDSDLGICVLFNSNSRLAKTVIPDLQEIVSQVYEQSLSAYASL
ncbi:serine hydrolase domain-containing protein [Maribacter sp. X9]|uniref:serine hydrolase domain-containing protein n=1 Tax=Maribacter sp. X9 TaxID=3402159 RepID=UPI003AF40164